MDFLVLQLAESHIPLSLKYGVHYLRKSPIAVDNFALYA